MSIHCCTSLVPSTSFGVAPCRGSKCFKGPSAFPFCLFFFGGKREAFPLELRKIPFVYQIGEVCSDSVISYWSYLHIFFVRFVKKCLKRLVNQRKKFFDFGTWASIPRANSFFWIKNCPFKKMVDFFSARPFFAIFCSGPKTLDSRRTSGPSILCRQNALSWHGWNRSKCYRVSLNHRRRDANKSQAKKHPAAKNQDASTPSSHVCCVTAFIAKSLYLWDSSTACTIGWCSVGDLLPVGDPSHDLFIAGVCVFHWRSTPWNWT